MGIILKPFSMLLLFLYEFFHSYGIALILFGILVKTILFPVTLKSKKSMIQMSMLSGRLQQLQKQYGKDQERYNLEVQKLYEKEKVNPMGGCLWSLIPMFVLLGLYAIIREPLFNLMDLPADLIEQVSELTGVANTGSYPQIAMAEALNDPAILASTKAALGQAGENLIGIDFTFLGVNLAQIPSFKFWTGGVNWNGIALFLLPIVSAVVSMLSMKVSMATNQMNKQQQSNPQMDATNRTMMITMPLMSLWVGFTVPAGLSVYWIAQYVVTMIQELICSKMLKKDYEKAREMAEQRAAQEKEEEKRRKEEARLERARRLEEEKKQKGKKKKSVKIEKEGSGVKREDSREGLRAYARGRAYIPDRFGGVTPYWDPNGTGKTHEDTVEESGTGEEPTEVSEKVLNAPDLNTEVEAIAENEEEV